MSKAKQLLTGLLVGTTLMSSGLAAGIVTSGVTMPVTAQAAKKKKMVTIKPVVLKNVMWKDGKWRDLKTRKYVVPAGYGWQLATPKYKGYKEVAHGNIRVFRNHDGSTGSVGNQWVYYKETTAKQQAANAKSRKAINVKETIKVNGKKVAIKARGLHGTILTVATPKIKGYTCNYAKIKVGITNITNNLLLFQHPKYTKNTSFAYKTSKATATRAKKSSNVKVHATFKVNNAKNAKKHKATYAVITDSKGRTNAKLRKNGTLNVTLKNRKSVKNVSVVAAYRTAKKHNKKTVYTYHVLSARKNATVKTTK